MNLIEFVVFYKLFVYLYIQKIFTNFLSVFYLVTLVHKLRHQSYTKALYVTLEKKFNHFTLISYLKNMKKKSPLESSIFRSLFLLIVICISCNTKMNTKKLNPMEGVWELSHFYHLANGDTLIIDTTKVQHKIYSNGYVIWNTDPAPNASEWHGYGTYTYKNDTITEILTSTSKSMKSDVNRYVIPIEHKGQSYKQVNTYRNNDTIYHNIEIYKKLNH